MMILFSRNHHPLADASFFVTSYFCCCYFLFMLCVVWIHFLFLSLTVSLANYFILFYLAGWIENILKTYLLIQCSQYFVIVTHHSKPTHTQKNENEKHVIKLYSNCDWMNIRRRRRRQSGCRWSSIVVVAAAVVQCPMLKTFRQKNKNVLHTSMLAIFNCHNFRFDVHLNSRK